MKNNEILDSPFLSDLEIDLSKVEFSGKNAGLAWKLEQAMSNIKTARVILFVIGGLTMLSLLFSLAEQALDTITLITSTIISIIFIVGGIMVYKYPIVSILVPLLIFLLLFIVKVSMMGFQGIIWDLVFIIVLSYGLYSAVSAKKFKQQLLAAYQRGEI